MNKRLLALPAALVAALLAVGTASAWPANSITVETNGCTYTIQVNDDQPGAFVGWEVRVWNAAPLAGELVASGSGTEDSQGHLTIGPFTAAPGHYNALVDYHLPVTESAEVVEFTLACTSETSTTTSTSTETSSETSTATTTETTTETSTVTSTKSSTATSTSTSTTTPTGAELGETGTPPSTPTGQELGTGGTPVATPPPTDTASFVPAPLNDWRAVLIALAGLIGAISWLARIPATAAVRKRNR